MTRRMLWVALTTMMLALLSFGAVTEARAAFNTADATAVKPMAIHFTFINNTPFTITICIVCPDGSVRCIVVPPGGIVRIIIPDECNPFRLFIIICGTRVFLPPGGGCLNNVNVGGGCADVCYDLGTQTVTMTPSPGPCPCP